MSSTTWNEWTITIWSGFFGQYKYMATKGKSCYSGTVEADNENDAFRAVILAEGL